MIAEGYVLLAADVIEAALHVVRRGPYRFRMFRQVGTGALRAYRKGGPRLARRLNRRLEAEIRHREAYRREAQWLRDRRRSGVWCEAVGLDHDALVEALERRGALAAAQTG